MNSKPILSSKLRGLVESRMKSTLKGIEETVQHVLEHQQIALEELKETVESLEVSFDLLSQKWNLQILYTLFLRNTMGFGAVKKILGVNSRTLSDKLKSLNRCGYIKRSVEQGPPLRVRYSLTQQGKNTTLLALPLLYYSRSNTSRS